MADDKPDVIIDNGSDSIKAGFGGEDLVRATFPTCVGHHLSQKVSPTF